ncbi:hypothetical protein [Nesterenkonia flava]|uniref:Uncharacterized protein n=1 Tax=Nesterenkonia flava TaxID=469799 RepID=A0ABU1FV57_9MICC|nr:hypothetical protein [Nesterenkonia flava]MDR5712046.1 hypothetical protein [Nesterenkonia flava]
MNPTREQIIRDLNVLSTGPGLNEDHMIGQARHIPYMDQVEHQMQVEGVGEDERGRVAEEFVICTIDTAPRIPDDDREILRIVLNIGHRGRTKNERKEMLASFLNLSVRTLERRGDIRVAFGRLARALKMMSHWPCGSNPYTDELREKTLNVSYRQVDLAVQNASAHMSETEAAQWFIEHLQERYVKALREFAANFGSTPDALRSALEAILDSGEYSRLIKQYDIREPVLNEFYTHQLVRAITGHRYWLRRSFLDYLEESIQLNREHILMDAWRAHDVQKRWQDAERTFRNTVAILLDIADQIESDDRWPDVKASAETEATDDDGDAEAVTDSE